MALSATVMAPSRGGSQKMLFMMNIGGA